MIDLIIGVAVPVLVAVYFGFQWWQAVNRCKRLERTLAATESHRDRMRNAITKWQGAYVHRGFALKYYATAANWQSEAGKHSAAYRDKGAIARKALQGES